MLDVGANDAGGVFRAEGELLGLFAGGAGTVLPGVHLFGDDVGFFTDSAGEKFGGFEDGGTDFAEAVAAVDGAGGGFDAVPELGFGGRRSRVPRTAFNVDICFSLADEPAGLGLLAGTSAMRLDASYRDVPVPPRRFLCSFPIVRLIPGWRWRRQSRVHPRC